MKVTRRGFLLSSLAGLTAASGYGRWLESGWLEVTERKIEMPRSRLVRPVRILHLTDLHADSEDAFTLVDEAITLGLDRRPDLVCLTGDYITRGRLIEQARYVQMLRRLSAAAPTFASFGNHDGGAWSASEGGELNVAAMRRALEDAGITCLHNESSLVTAGDQELNIAGLGDLWAHEAIADRAFAGIKTPGLPTVTLTHNPDTVEMLRPFSWDLTLCGHTHGGQIVIPVLDFAPYVPISDHRFVRGLHQLDQRSVFINRGIGSILGVRFNCRPEISILELTPVS